MRLGFRGSQSFYEHLKWLSAILWERPASYAKRYNQKKRSPPKKKPAASGRFPKEL